MNSTALIGRLTQETAMKYSQSGTAILKNTVAVNRKFKKDETDFINILAFGKTAELIGNHLNKGDQVGIEGHIQTGSYENAEGKKVYTTEVVVDNITFIGGKKKEDKPAQKYTADPGDPFKDNGQINISNDDLPF
jgi:single-strand DNA-binding protein